MSPTHFRVRRKPVLPRIDVDLCVTAQKEDIRARNGIEGFTPLRTHINSKGNSRIVTPSDLVSGVSTPYTPDIGPEIPNIPPSLGHYRPGLALRNKGDPCSEEVRADQPFSACGSETGVTRFYERVDTDEFESSGSLNAKDVSSSNIPRYYIRSGDQDMDSQIKKRTSSLYSQDSADFSIKRMPRHLDTSPLMIRSHMYATGESSYELLFQISANKAPDKHAWKRSYEPHERRLQKKLAGQAISAVQFAGRAVNLEPGDELRLVSSFHLNNSTVVASLFQKTLIVTANSEDGFDDFVGLFNLDDDRTEVRYASENGLFLRNDKEEPIILRSGTSTISAWMSAINDTTLIFPLVDPVPSHSSESLGEPFYPDFGGNSRLDYVLCTPVAHVTRLVPRILEQLGSQDRLALVVVTNDGSCATLCLHKPSWPHWADIVNFEFDTCGLFESATKPTLQSAVSILGSKITGRQQSIVVVSGCPLVSTVAPDTITVHAIGVDSDYDSHLISRLVTRSGRFYHARTEQELVQCCSGIAAADRTYVNYNVDLMVNIGRHTLSECTPQEFMQVDRTQNHNSVLIRLGGLIAGQSRAVMFQVNAAPADNEEEKFEYIATSTSAITGQIQISRSSVRIDGLAHASELSARAVYFDRLVLVCADILTECQNMASEEHNSELCDLLLCAYEKISSTTAAEVKQFDAQKPSRSIESYRTLCLKSLHLASGLRELAERIRYEKEKCIVDAMLREAYHILAAQCAVTGKTKLEQVFFENLECNRL